MDYLERNLATIKQYNKDLYERIIEYTEEQEEGFLLEYGVARNGEPCLYMQRNETIYRLNSEVNPSYEAKKWVEQYDENHYQSVIELFGLGTGVFAREIVEKYSKETLIFIYEPSKKVLLHTLSYCDLSDILGRENVFLMTGEEELSIYSKRLKAVLGWQSIGFQLRIVTPEYNQIFLEEYKQFLEIIQEASMYARIQMNTEVRFGKSIPQNTIANLAYVEGAKVLKGIPEDVVTQIPAILVAAGPSLDKNMHVLKEAKGKAIIIAVDRAVNSLLENGIIPDFTATIDPEKSIANYENPISEEIPLLCFLEANTKILEKHKGKKIFMHQASGVAKVFERFGHQDNVITAGGSVATATFTSLLQLGIKTIIMVGQDLAIYGEQTHANAAMKGNKIYRTEEADRIKVRGNNGGEVETREDLYQYLKWYGDVITSKTEITVVNATEGGAYIEGTKVATLEEAIKEYCKETVDIVTLLESLTPAAESKEQVEQVVEEFLADFVQMKKSTKEAISITYDLIRNVIEKNCGNSTASRLGKKLSELNANMLETDCYALVDLMMSGDVKHILSDIHLKMENVYEDTRKTYEYSKYLYEAMLPCIERMIEQMEQTIEKISNQ